MHNDEAQVREQPHDPRESIRTVLQAIAVPLQVGERNPTQGLNKCAYTEDADRLSNRFRRRERNRGGALAAVAAAVVGIS